jgi:hypothetical protein
MHSEPVTLPGMGGEGRIHSSSEIAAADWVRERIDSFEAWTVGSIVPLGFEAYLRIFHPVEGAPGDLARWSEAAAASGRVMHPHAEFEHLARPSDPGDHLETDEPTRGELLPDLVGALSVVLAPHTRTPERCWFCIWEGGWVHGPGGINVAIGASARERAEAQRQWESAWGRSFPAEALSQPRVRLPGRNYVLLEGPLDSVPEIGELLTWEGRLHFEPHSPNLWWPDDRTWCVATDIDLDSTYVGGSAALVRDVLRDELFEAFEVNASDVRGDTVNREP